MKILHTSDWHIGKRLADRERLSEQEEALDEIAAICAREKVDLVLVAGDVFDTFMPSAEAEELFFRAVKKIAGQDRAIVAISGNHDDGVRLSASAPLAGEQGVYLFGNRPAGIPVGGNRPVRAVAAGDYWVVIENRAGEKVYINALPYPNEARFREEKSDEEFSDKISRWIARGEEGYDGSTPHILLAHLFVAGGRTSESERNIDLGGARAVPQRCLPQEGYVALGHLHKPQRAAENARYSGSLLQYSFDEAGGRKGVCLLETRGREFTVREIPLTAGRGLVRLECNGTEEGLRLLQGRDGEFVELTLNLTAPLTSSQTQALSGACEGLVSLIARVKAEERAGIASRSALGAEELFTQYYQSQFGEAPDGELLQTFLSLLSEES